jgi:hypothetical protein
MEAKKIIIPVSKNSVQEVDLTKVYPYMSWNPTYTNFMTKNPGEEHYKLLAYFAQYLSKHIESPTISDIGTLHGSSALSLSIVPTCMVTTYDILNLVPTPSPQQPMPNVQTINNVPNIKRKIMSGQLDIVNIAKSDLVLLDIDPHEGTEETKFVNLLEKNGFKGILIVDDIHLNEGMRAFWAGVPEKYKKLDLTHLGHWTGTGVIMFDKERYDILEV